MSYSESHFNIVTCMDDLYDGYNVTITVTMQLINILSFLLFTTCFGLSRPSSGVSLYAKTVTLY
jgi:hypothetical protein